MISEATIATVSVKSSPVPTRASETKHSSPLPSSKRSVYNQGINLRKPNAGYARLTFHLVLLSSVRSGGAGKKKKEKKGGIKKRKRKRKKGKQKRHEVVGDTKHHKPQGMGWRSKRGEGCT
jgi:hypothetical protein